MDITHEQRLVAIQQVGREFREACERTAAAFEKFGEAWRAPFNSRPNQ